VYFGNGTRINNPHLWKRRRILRRRAGAVLLPSVHVHESTLRRLSRDGWFNRTKVNKRWQYVRTDKPWVDKERGTFDFDHHRRVFEEN
jgi:hypothetical protein